MSKRNVFVLALGLLAILGGFLIVYWNAQGPAEDYTALTQCLSQKGVTMYGAQWCAHCQNQKKTLGKAFSLVPYVECPNNPQACIDLNVKAYPTWIFPDGNKIEGELTPERLAELSGCSLL